MKELNSYSSLFSLGHRALNDLFCDEIIIEEKIDGSQISFGLIDGELQIRSKGQKLNIEAPEKLFSLAVDVIKDLQLLPNHIYRAEYLRIPKHNVLVYNRIPKNHIIIFDIAYDIECYFDYNMKKIEAERLGLEVVPLFYQGLKENLNDNLTDFLEKESILGGQKIEGFVIKNYHKFNPEKKILIAKIVSDEFKEIHKKTFKNADGSKNSKEFILDLAEQYRTPARWNKAIIHLKEKDLLSDSKKDIGNLIKEVQADILKECSDDIKEQLFNWAINTINRIVIKGLPEWYINKLSNEEIHETQI